MNENKIVDKTADKTNWPVAARELWHRIAAHSFEDPGASLTFTTRLARDHGWSLDQARGAIKEYRRFCFLAMLSPSQVTPSEDVDEVWHQHLTYSRDYWEVWCGTVLRRPLHHHPTKGGAGEGARFAEQYARTLALYETWFGSPDPTFWPGTASRFAGRPRFRIVDRDRAIVIPLPALVRRLVGATILVATLAPTPAAAGLGVLDWPADAFLRLYVALVILTVASSVGYQVLMRFLASGATPTRRATFSPVELALMAAGEGRAADVLALDLLRSGRIKVAGEKIEVPPRSPGTGPSLADVLRREGTEFSRSRLVEILGPSVRPSWDVLAAEGWTISPGQAASIRRVTLLLLCPTAALGVAKIVSGLGRGKPIGFLIFLTILMLLLSAIANRRSLASTVGLVRLRDYREENARALRAPQPGEVLAAFAVVGAVALTGTPLAAYAGTMPKSDGGSGCGSGDGGDGGGCGGCGGA